LAIKDDANSSVFIVEFKVGAELEPKQHPNKKAFFAKVREGAQLPIGHFLVRFRRVGQEDQGIYP
jgi:hypothetical protein